jgi:hypothetical protein
MVISAVNTYVWCSWLMSENYGSFVCYVSYGALFDDVCYGQAYYDVGF